MDNEKKSSKTNLEILRDSLQLASAGLTLAGEILDAGGKFVGTYMDVMNGNSGQSSKPQEKSNTGIHPKTNIEILSDSLQLASAGLTLASGVLDAGIQFTDTYKNVMGNNKEDRNQRKNKESKKSPTKTNLEILRDSLQLASAGLKLTSNVLDAGAKFAGTFMDTMDSMSHLANSYMQSIDPIANANYVALKHFKQGR